MTIEEFIKQRCEIDKIHETGYVFKDDYENYLDYLLDTNENLTEEEAENQILNLDYKKAIFVYIDLPDKF